MWKKGEEEEKNTEYVNKIRAHSCNYGIYFGLNGTFFRFVVLSLVCSIISFYSLQCLSFAMKISSGMRNSETIREKYHREEKEGPKQKNTGEAEMQAKP